MSELELQEKQTSKKLNRLKTETKNLQNHVSMLHLSVSGFNRFVELRQRAKTLYSNVSTFLYVFLRVNEWRFGESSDTCTVYTFLHETFHLQLVYETGKIFIALLV